MLALSHRPAVGPPGGPADTAAPPRPEHDHQPDAAPAPPRWAPASGIWWLNPIVVTLAISMSTLLISLLFDDAEFRRLWRSPKALTPATVEALAIGLVAFCLGAAVVNMLRPVARQSPYPLLNTAQVALTVKSATVCFRLTVLGYLAFGLQAVRVGIRPADLVNAFSDDAVLESFQTRVTTIPGVSTCTQFGVAFCVLVTVVRPYLRGTETSALLRRRLFIVLGLALVRAFYLTERLALLELLIPLAAAATIGAPFGTKAYRRMRTLPVMLMPFVVMVFAAFEYTRSWSWYHAHGSRDFGSFVISRFAGYYVTAYNNGQIRMTHEHHGLLPTDTLGALWTAPVISQLHVYERLSGIKLDSGYNDMLTQFGNPEFNNPSGLVSPYVDYGWIGGMIYLGLFGLLAGWLYGRLRRRDPFGMLLYPLVFLTLLEMPRYLWLPEGRSVPSVIALVVVAVLLRRRAHWTQEPASVRESAGGTV